MLFLTKLSTLLCLVAATLHASVYDDETLTIFAKITPRMILMSSQKEKIKDNIQICVVNDKVDERSAISLIDKIHDAYPNGITNHPLALTNTTYASMEKCQNSPLIFLFNSNDKNIEKALQYSHDRNAMSISYDPKYLENGVNASLFFGKKVTPYLNINALRKNKIEVDNLLIRISKIYLYESEK